LPQRPTIRVFAVDDEALALRRLELLLRRIDDVELIGTARSGAQALAGIAETRPDLVLLDVRMGSMDGFAVVEQLSGPDMPLVIFVTAFDQFAVRAFEVSAVDYLVKPVEMDRLTAAIDKARAALATQDSALHIAELQSVIAALRQDRPAAAPRFESEIWAQRRGEFVRVRAADIDWIEAERDYVHLHADDKSYLLRETISGMQARLDPQAFLRIRRSALVRVDAVTGIRKAGYGDLRVQLASGVQLRVGRTYVKQVRGVIAGLRADQDDDAA
jgi:DNA-binding LytR/AlgR family response regulator